MSSNPKHAQPEEALCAVEERPIGVNVPLPLSKRLDLLVELLEKAGHRAFRKDVVAALVLAAPETEEELADLFMRYRRARASDAAVAAEPVEKVLDLKAAKPGRRSKRRAA